MNAELIARAAREVLEQAGWKRGETASYWASPAGEVTWPSDLARSIDAQNQWAVPLVRAQAMRLSVMVDGDGADCTVWQAARVIAYQVADTEAEARLLAIWRALGGTE